MKIKKTILAAIYILCFVPSIIAQDIHFSQFFEAPLIRNPSLAGIFTGDVRVQGVYRDQWNSVTDAYKTGSLNGEYKKPVGKGDDFLTMGMELFYDRAGTIGWTTTQVMPALNYHKSLSSSRNMYLSLGFMGGLVQRRFDRTKMTTNSQYDGMGDGEIFNQAKYSYLDGSVGMSFNTNLNDNPQDNMFVGVAYHHLNRPQNSFYRNPEYELNPKWVFSGGVKFGVTESSYLTIQADHSRQGEFQETIGGVMYGIKIGENIENPAYTIHGGAFLRLNDALIPTIKLDYNPVSVALSYDVNISKLKVSSYGRGGFEISISYVGFLDRYNSSADAVRCPRF